MYQYDVLFGNSCCIYLLMYCSILYVTNYICKICKYFYYVHTPICYF